MPKYYCEYCDIYLTHSSPGGRRQHNAGRKHTQLKVEYYMSVLADPKFSPPAHVRENIPHVPLPGPPPLPGRSGGMMMGGPAIIRPPPPMIMRGTWQMPPHRGGPHRPQMLHHRQPFHPQQHFYH